MSGYFTRLAGSLLVLGLTACSVAPTPPSPQEIPLESVGLYYSRTSLGSTDFEQYRLTGSTLFRECGKILGGRFNPTEQSVVTVTPETLNEVKDRAWQIQRFVRERDAEFQKAGDNTGMFDPGILNLSLQFPNDRVEVKTSFDSISIPSAPREHRLSELAVALRKAVPTIPCGRKFFYGLGEPRMVQ